MDEELDMSYLDSEDIVDDVMGVDFNVVTHLRRQLQLRSALAALTMLCIVAHALYILNMAIETSSIHECLLNKDRRREQLMSYLVHTNRCRDIIRMGPEAFINLCNRLRSTGLVNDAFRSTVEEQVAKFLHIIGHNVKNRSVGFFFHRSGSTVSRHFHNVLDAILSLESELLIQPSGAEVHPHVQGSSRFYPYFKVNLFKDAFNSSNESIFKQCLNILNLSNIRIV